MLINITAMSRLQIDFDIIQVELNFLKAKYEQAFRERDFRELKKLSLWISKLEKKLEQIQQKNLKNTTDYIREYKNGKGNNCIQSRTEKQRSRSEF
jgi:hypothetical protein